LLARVGAGDQAAFASLYYHMAPAAYCLAQRLVRDAALAEEVMQDAFSQVWSTSSAFDRTRGSAQSWVMTIVHRRAVDVVRHEQSARERVLRVGARSIKQPFDVVWESALQRSEREQITAALASLTVVQRRAIELAYYEGMTCREVAMRLGIPIGTAKSRIHEAVRRLRRALVAADR
jgi:RNA polymerase sigma-70 factor (ECF subfamily)